jgi:Holliday junction resolvase RusA-like endonuclease
VSWRVTIPGQALSVNHIYKTVYRYDHGGRRYKGRALTEEAQAYFDGAVYLIRAARPPAWAPAGQVRVVFDLYLHRSVDSDNAMKLVSDAIEAATGINDSRFLHCTRSKTTRLPLSQARIEVEIDDQSSLLSSAPAP